MMVVVANLDEVLVMILFFLCVGADDLAEVDRHDYPNEVVDKNAQILVQDNPFNIWIPSFFETCEISHALKPFHLTKGNVKACTDDKALAGRLEGICKMLLALT